MEVKPGYKQTEVGVIPTEWEVKPLADLFTFQNGVNADKSAYGKGVAFINVLEVITHSSLTEAKIPGRVSLSVQARSAFAVQFGDVLFNRTSETQEEVGLASVYTGNAEVVFGGFVIRAKPRANSMDPTFTSYVLRSPAVRAQIVARGQGAIRANIGQRDLSRVLLFLPSIAEQEAIAVALSDADAFIECLEQLVARKRQLKRGAMQELLTGKNRLRGFGGSGSKKSEIGELPNDWCVLKIGKIADVKTGPFGSSLHERDYVDDGTPIITVEHLGERGITQTNLPMVSSVDYKRLSSYSLEEGDIVFSRVGSVDRNARVSSVERGWLFSGRLLRLRVLDGIDTRYLSYHFHSEPFKRRVRAVAVGQTMASLNTQILKSVLVMVPPLAEQIAIADILSDMDAEIASLEAKLAKARQIKRGMMRELLTGKIRLEDAAKAAPAL